MGHSMGGRMLIQLANVAPHRVLAAVLLDAAAGTPFDDIDPLAGAVAAARRAGATGCGLRRSRRSAATSCARAQSVRPGDVVRPGAQCAYPAWAFRAPSGPSSPRVTTRRCWTRCAKSGCRRSSCTARRIWSSRSRVHTTWPNTPTVRCTGSQAPITRGCWPIRDTAPIWCANCWPPNSATHCARRHANMATTAAWTCWADSLLTKDSSLREVNDGPLDVVGTEAPQHVTLDRLRTIPRERKTRKHPERRRDGRVSVCSRRAVTSARRAGTRSPPRRRRARCCAAAPR